jgi:Encapsulating protein for peroxidase
MSNGNFWPPNVWTQFNGSPTDKTQPGLLKTTMGPMQVAQHVFPTTVTGNDNSIPADTIDLKTGVPSTGTTRAFATIRKPFTLFPVHIADPALTMASNQVTLAGQALALIEDTLFFQGNDARLPAGGGKGVNLPDGDQAKLDGGLLGIAAKNKVISVPPGKKKAYGLATYSAVVDGIAQFTTDQQGPPYALILSPDTFADASLPLEDEALVTPSSAIQALLASGPFVMSPGLPARTGLLASLGGKTTTLYIGTGPLVEYNSYDGSVYSFTGRESIQFLNIDSRSLIKLKFEEPKP